MPLARTNRSRLIVGTGALTTAKSKIDLTEVAGSVETYSKALPDVCHLVKLEVEVTAIASSAATVTWNLAKDALGKFGITPEVTSTIVVGADASTNGSFNALIEVDYVKTLTNGVTEHLYLVARTDTGTCTLAAFLSWVP